MEGGIVFFGGTFDPPHVEHVQMVRAVIEELSPKKVIIMPTFKPPHKNVFDSATPDQRLEMCKLAFSSFKEVEVSDMEIKAGGLSYSYITMEKLYEKYGEKIRFLVGTDMLESFHTWKYPEKILEYADMILCVREESHISGDESAKRFYERFGVKVTILDYIGKDYSSSSFKIQRMLGLETTGFLTREVSDYVEKNRLYIGGRNELFVREHLKKSRLVHTCGVMTTALKISKKLGQNTDKALTAALLHDSAKYLDYKSYSDFEMDDDVPPPVVHQFLGAYVAERILGIDDEEILNAIRYHTSGRPGMGILEKIIFVSDMIEPSREFDWVYELRKAVDEDFEKGFLRCLKRSYDFVVEKKDPVYHLTKDALDYYMKEDD